ncbi:fungal-specific transcription factor domain-containing protein [Ganoderma leucocontextum]|nr:fungal-specific transcription factor domain-containing protein [Ganoderma leucocontextum]
MSSNSQLTAKNKRRNATLSCAECRRLKLRCSRVFPCASCVKKGCAAICPDGSLTTGKGNRFVLANTEALHDKITILANRVRALEDALEGAHSNLSREVHPLLSDELRALKRPLERESPEEQAQEQEHEVVESINVGSLSISESGHTQFFGGMANAWYLLQQEAGSDDEEDSPQMQLPAEIPWLSHTFPFYTAVSETAAGIRETVLASLPDQAKARELVTIYYRHAAWMYTPIPEAEFEDTIFSRIYDQRMETEPAPKDSHRLAVFCLVLALGALLDLDRPSLSTDATRYYQLGRAVLSLDSILESQSIPAIQALILMCHYMFHSFVEGPRWALMGLAVKLAQSLGLHRDSGQWNLDPRETFRRRSLFYELYTYDSWQSLTYGRPPSFAMSFVDCQIPEEPTKNDQGEYEMSFAVWKHRFSSKCLSVVHEQAFGAKVPRYHTVSELDKRVRDFYVPPSLRVPGFGGASMEGPHIPPPVELTMQRYIAFAIKEISLFYLHRGFFAKALEDHPGDPLGSKYAPSVLAAYNSACSFVGLIRSLYSQHPGLTERMWFLFTHVFSCSIVLGSIATKCPNMALAPSALSNLDSALNLFDQVSRNARAAKVLPVLRKLKARALAAKQSMNTGPISASTSQSSMDNPMVKEEDDELAALGGKTRLISRRSPGSNSQPSSPQQSSTHSMSPIEQSAAASHMSPETPPSAPEPTSPIQAENTQWNSGYVAAADMYGYAYPPQEMNGWQHPQPQPQPHVQHDHPYLQMQSMGMNMEPVQYVHGYEHLGHTQAMASHSHQYMSQSQVHPEGHVHTSDPHASWNVLFAQFNQV